MFKKFMRTLSFLLVVAMLWNMLPVGVLGAELREMQNDSNLSADMDSIAKVQEGEKVTVIGELTDRRTETAKEFLLSNGNILAAVYGTPVHYQENGQWKDIDNTLVARTNGTYTNTAGVWAVSFPETLGGSNQITITKDGYTLSFAMAGKLSLGSGAVARAAAADQTLAVSAASTSRAQVQITDFSQAKADAKYAQLVRDKLTSRLSYANVYSNTDVIYDLDSNRVKESVVISQYDSNLRGYKYTLNTGGMIPVVGEDGRIDFYDEKREKIIVTMPAPFLVDANYEYSWDVQVSLTGSGSNYTLTYLLPRQWLADQSRAWPVVLDPVVEVDNALKNVADQTVFSAGSKSSSWGIIQCGKSATLGISRFYLGFNAIPTLGPADVVVDARVTLTKAVNSQKPFYVSVHAVDDTWTSSGITWDNMPGYDVAIADYLLVKESGEYTWDITEIARGWYETGENTGMMFRASEAVEGVNYNHWAQFYSSDYGAYEPELTLEYRNASGLEDYWDYTSASAGRAGTGYVNAFNGNLVWVRNLMGFAGNRMPVSIDLVYNSGDREEIGSGENCTVNYGIGYGWRTNYNQRAYALSGTDYYVWEDADGTKHYFKLDETDNIYYDEDNLDLTLTVNSSGTIIIQDLVGNTSTFDGNGRLTKLQNNQQTTSSIDITYTTSTGNFISTITDGVGRVYQFTYSNSLLSKVSYKAAGSAELHYVNLSYSNSNLTGITDKDNTSCTYTYSNNLLLTAKDSHNVGLCYEYNMGNQVIKVTENSGSSAGNYLSFTYGRNRTKMEDKQENVQYMLFNSRGNTISIQDDKGGAVFAKYATDEDDAAENNQLTLSSDLQNTVVNLIHDGSFENGTIWYSSNDVDCGIETADGSVVPYSGNKALSAEYAQGDDPAISFGSFTAAVGESYTLTAYIKVISGSAYLRFASGDTVCAQCVHSTQLDVGQWQRFSISYTNAGSGSQRITAQAVLDEDSEVLIDCVQIEKSATSGRFNLVTNGDFTVSSGDTANYRWSAIDINPATEDYDSDEDDSGRETLTTSPAPIMDANTMKIEGTYSARKRFSQTIPMSGGTNDVYVLAGWAKGYVPEEKTLYYGDRKLAMELTFYRSNGTIVGEPNTISFSPHIENWQYVAGQIFAPFTYDYMVLSLVCDYQASEVWFDGIQLFQGSIGNDYTYNENGDIETVTDAQGQVTWYTYNGRDVDTVIYPNGSSVEYTYDIYHNVLTELTSYDNGTSEEEISLIKHYTYDVYGNVLTTEENNDADTRVTASYTGNGNYLTTVSDEQNGTTTYTYNTLTGLLTDVTDSEGGEVHYTYDTMFRPLTSSQESSGGDMTVGYTYTGDRLNKVATPSTTYDFSYGAFGLTQQVKAGNYTLASYTYDGNKNLNKLTYGNNATVEYEYDSQGRVIEEIYKDSAASTGTDVIYTYDDQGRLASVNDGFTDLVTTYYYDAYNQVIRQEVRGSSSLRAMSFRYDALGRVVGVTDHTSVLSPIHTSYAYNSQNLPILVSNGTVTQAVAYNSRGLPIQTITESIFSNEPVKEELYTYDPLEGGHDPNKLYKHRITIGDITSEYVYTYDTRGNISQIAYKPNTTSTQTVYISYEYDEANQLIRENNKLAGYTWVMTYDNAGNMLTRKKYSYTTGSLGAVMSTQTCTYGESGWGDRLKSINGTAVESDAVGNIENDGTWEYAWKYGRHLVEMSSGNTVWEFAYDASGMRTQRTGNSTTYTYTYDGTTLSRMTAGSNTLEFAYGASGLPMAVKYNSTYYYYVTNALGDVIAILNDIGTKVVTYTYDAWGNITETGGAMASTLGTHNPFRYRSYVYDQETGLYYLQSRYYSPKLCRFISADDPGYLGADGTPISYNLFAYCGNNPIMNYDPTGHFLLSTAVLIGAVVGSVLGATAGGVIAYNVAKEQGAEGWELVGWTVLGVVGGGTIGAAAGAAIGYGVGYLAGGTYANGLSAKTISSSVKAFFSDGNKVHKLFKLSRHKLSGYTAKTGAKLMKDTLAHGIILPYKSVQSAYWAMMNSEVTFTIINGILKISDMWIR